MSKNQPTIAIQGSVSSYHHQVAQAIFGESVSILACDSFPKVSLALVNNEADFGIMAIENSIAGSIIPNYALIDQHHFSIISEYYLDIQHCFMGLDNQDMQDILEVRSHPMALLQCMETLKKYPHIKLVEDKDTAMMAEEIAQKKLKNVMAIASEATAKLFGLKVLLKDVQTVKNNRTRFFVVSKQADVAADCNKASLKFELNNTKGSLAAVLNVMNECQLNLTKIQSLPIIEKPFQYAFFVDFIFDNPSHLNKALQILAIMTQNFKVFGQYKAFESNTQKNDKKI